MIGNVVCAVWKIGFKAAIFAPLRQGGRAFGPLKSGYWQVLQEGQHPSAAQEKTVFGIILK